MSQEKEEPKTGPNLTDPEWAFEQTRADPAADWHLTEFESLLELDKSTGEEHSTDTDAILLEPDADSPGQLRITVASASEKGGRHAASISFHQNGVKRLCKRLAALLDVE